MQSTPLRICVLGDVGAGKSSLTLQFTQSTFPVNFDPTIEDVYKKDIQVCGESYTLHVLDTAIQDDYSLLKDLQLEEADGFVLVYSVTSMESFSKLGDPYRHIMRINSNLPPTILLGNQTDLHNQRQVSYAQGEELASEFGIPLFLETSAKSNINVKEAFIELAEAIVDNHKKTVLSASDTESEGFGSKTAVLRPNSTARSDAAAPKTFTIGASLEAQKVAISKNNISAVASRALSTQPTKSAKKGSEGGCCVVM